MRERLYSACVAAHCGRWKGRFDESNSFSDHLGWLRIGVCLFHLIQTLLCLLRSETESMYFLTIDIQDSWLERSTSFYVPNTSPPLWLFVIALLHAWNHRANPTSPEKQTLQTPHLNHLTRVYPACCPCFKSRHRKSDEVVFCHMDIILLTVSSFQGAGN